MVAVKKTRTDEVEEEMLSSIDKLLEAHEELDLARKKSTWCSCLTTFLSNPRLKGMLTKEDLQIFMYLDSIVVNESNDIGKGDSITFKFTRNPYFENTTLTKTFKYLDDVCFLSKNYLDDGNLVMKLTTIGTTIKWKDGKGPVDGSDIVGNKRPRLEDSFFKWFGTEVPVKVVQDEVADLISELWVNPFEYLNYGADEDEDSEEDGDTEGEYDDDEEEEEEDGEDVCSDFSAT